MRTDIDHETDLQLTPAPLRCRVSPCGVGLLLVVVGTVTVARACAAAVHSGTGRSQEPDHPPLLSHPVQRPGYLGVSLRDLDAAEATHLHRRGAMGAMIVTVDRDAPAWAAGLRPQDVILEVNGEPVDGVETLRQRLREYPAHETLTVRVRRGDEEMSFSVTLGDEDEIAQSAMHRHLKSSVALGLVDPITGNGTLAANTIAPAPPAPPPPASRGLTSTLFDALIPGSVYTGLEVDSLTPQLAAFFGVHAKGGLLVTAVIGGSPAATAGLAAGDVIIRANNQAVVTRGSLAHAMRGGKGNAIPLAVLREHQELILSLLPEKRKKL